MANWGHQNRQQLGFLNSKVTQCLTQFAALNPGLYQLTEVLTDRAGSLVIWCSFECLKLTIQIPEPAKQLVLFFNLFLIDWNDSLNGAPSMKPTTGADKNIKLTGTITMDRKIRTESVNLTVLLPQLI